MISIELIGKGNALSEIWNLCNVSLNEFQIQVDAKSKLKWKASISYYWLNQSVNMNLALIQIIIKFLWVTQTTRNSNVKKKQVLVLLLTASKLILPIWIRKVLNLTYNNWMWITVTGYIKVLLYIIRSFMYEFWRYARMRCPFILFH